MIHQLGDEVHGVHPTQILDLADDGDRQREVYARFGLAMFYAQGLEATFKNLIMLKSMGHLVKTEEELDSLEDRLSAQVAGRLVGELRDRGFITPDQNALCVKALTQRNHLAHRFFYVSAMSFRTPSGMQQMLDEVDAARYLFLEADDVLSASLFEYGAQFGLTSERVEEFLAENYPD